MWSSRYLEVKGWDILHWWSWLGQQISVLNTFLYCQFYGLYLWHILWNCLFTNLVLYFVACIVRAGKHSFGNVAGLADAKQALAHKFEKDICKGKKPSGIMQLAKCCTRLLHHNGFQKSGKADLWETFITQKGSKSYNINTKHDRLSTSFFQATKHWEVSTKNHWINKATNIVTLNSHLQLVQD